MPSTLLTTKLYRPRPTASLVARPRLTQRLDEALQKGHPLILVVAPAGYGKTTLVSHWLDGTGVPSTWLLLDEGDNDPLRFFAYVAGALQKIDSQVGQSLLDAFRTEPPSPDALVSPLINDLAAVERPVVLVLDDYHLITHALIQEAMAFLLDHAPPNLHLVVLTRVDPSFPLPRLRVRGQMTEIRAGDLRFTLEEMAAFLNSIHRLALSQEQITALESRTEGWAAGVQLAALSLQGYDAGRAAEFIAAFSGSHHYVIDYLADEVLRRQPEEVQAFLLQTSILDRFTASLCDAVLGGAPQSDRMLLELERKNLFLIPLDDERLWYRYHHLFSDLLFQRLKQAQPDRLSELYLRAAAWLERNGYLQSAVGYALKAQDYELATRLMDQAKDELGGRGQLHVFLSWVGTLPEELVRADPVLCRFYAVCLLLTGHVDAAEKWLGRAEELLRTVTAPEQRARLRVHTIPSYRSIIARFRGDFAAAVALGERGLAEVPDGLIRDRGVALLFLGHAHFHAGNTQAAERVLLECMQLTLAAGHQTAYVNACHHFAQLRVLQGRLHEAAAAYERAIQFVREQSGPVYAGTERAGRADLLREWNQLEEAAGEMQEGLEVAEAGDDIFSLRDVYVARVRLALAQKDWDVARSTLQTAEQVARRGPAVTEIANFRAWRARLDLAQGDLAQAGAWAETRAPDKPGPFTLQDEFELLTLARVRLAEGRADDATALLERIRSAAEEAGRHGRALEAQVLQALADQAAGNHAQALERLARVLARAEPEGYVRLFVDEGEPMARLLQRAVNRGILPAYSSKLLAAIEAEKKAGLARPPGEESLVEALSEREVEVLYLVAAGLSNAEIADKLVLSVRTVKKHVQNILGKLGASSRTAAVARARELGLLQ